MERVLIHQSWKPFVMKRKADIKRTSRQAVIKETEEGMDVFKNAPKMFFNQRLLGF